MAAIQLIELNPNASARKPPSNPPVNEQTAEAPITQPLAWITLVVGTSAAVFFAAHRQYQDYRNIHHNRGKLARNMAIDVIGILLTIIFSVLLAVFAIALIAPPIAIEFEKAIPGTGLLAGIIAGLVCSLGIGLGIGFLVRWIRGKITVRLQ